MTDEGDKTRVNPATLALGASGALDELTGRLAVLFRRYAAAFEPRVDFLVLDEQLLEQYRKDMKLLVAEFGAAAIDAALDRMPKEVWPSVSLH